VDPIPLLSHAPEVSPPTPLGGPLASKGRLEQFDRFSCISAFSARFVIEKTCCLRRCAWKMAQHTVIFSRFQKCRRRLYHSQGVISGVFRLWGGGSAAVTPSRGGNKSVSPPWDRPRAEMSEMLPLNYWSLFCGRCGDFLSMSWGIWAPLGRTRPSHRRYRAQPSSLLPSSRCLVCRCLIRRCVHGYQSLPR
jgi:hypothetical protein